MVASLLAAWNDDGSSRNVRFVPSKLELCLPNPFPVRLACAGSSRLHTVSILHEQLLDQDSTSTFLLLASTFCLEYAVLFLPKEYQATQGLEHSLARPEDEGLHPLQRSTVLSLCSARVCSPNDE